VVALTCLLWFAAAALTWWLLACRAAVPEPAPGPADPHARTVAEFMRAVHDWDRGE
jgi:hypothetical protein